MRDWGIKIQHRLELPKAIAQNISQRFLIIYGVLLLTIFMDLIVAVSVGVFIADILTIERLSNLQSEEVKLITDTN